MGGIRRKSPKRGGRDGGGHGRNSKKSKEDSFISKVIKILGREGFEGRLLIIGILVLIGNFNLMH